MIGRVAKFVGEVTYLVGKSAIKGECTVLDCGEVTKEGQDVYCGKGTVEQSGL